MFQFSCLSDMREKQLPIFQRKKKGRGQNRGTSILKQKENSSENLCLPHFGTSLQVCTAIMKPLTTSQPVIQSPSFLNLS